MDSDQEIPETGLVGAAESMRRLRRELRAVAPMHSTVLLTGETGVGKGVAARAVHALANRPDRPFVHVDCVSLAPHVIESELFGHERGAFTGATERRRGRLELAEDGTLFLDEIGDLDPGLQVKLLRVLQDRTFERVGDSRPRSVRARIVAATSRDLRRAVEEGGFRAELLFRLNVFRIHIPPLRERPEDLSLLVRHGLERLADRLGTQVPRLPDAVYERLRAHPWPGNVRELFNLLERFLVQHQAGLVEEDPAAWFDAILAESEVEVAPARSPSRRPGSRAPDASRDLLETELRATGGNISRVARRLGIPRSTLRHRIRRYGLESLIPRD